MHCIVTVVLTKQLNFKSLITRSKRSSCYFVESQDWTSSLSLDSLQKQPIYHCLLERVEVVYYFCADTVKPPVSAHSKYHLLWLLMGGGRLQELRP